MLKQTEQTHPHIGEPVWELARLYPAQGDWSERDYLNLEVNWLIEYSNGILEVLEMPTPYHQNIVALINDELRSWIKTHSTGYTYFAPVPLNIFSGRYREPDLIFCFERQHTRDSKQLTHADLGVEVVSNDRDHDFVTKREEYAVSGIPEYWIVDPKQEEIHILVLEKSDYVERGIFARGQVATSALLPGFEVRVSELFDEA
ncbi:MAG: Uma2 family endonuclease [Chloroflexi bacterium]|nr:Uma2 family endonuclease [Chloroflexota bacterium]